METKQDLISIIVPVYNEQECLPALFERLEKLRLSREERFEYLFVDDGSKDDSCRILKGLAAEHEHVRYISFSRNFGHEIATTAGMDHVRGDAVVLMDADLQHPPEVIPELIDKWREGFEVVYVQRPVRRGESWFKRFTSWCFYRMIRVLSDVDIPPDTGDFRLMDRAVVLEFRRCREQSRFVRGLVAWTGFRQTAVVAEMEERFAGKTKYSVSKLMILALDAVIGFSATPLRLGTWLGLIACAISVIMALWVIVEKLVWGIPVPGYSTIIVGMFFLGGVQLMMLGLMGEYIGRIYRESQKRPLYIISESSDTEEPEK